MSDYSWKSICKNWGEPALRFIVEQYDPYEDPIEVAVFKIGGFGGCVVFARYKEEDYWNVNSGERHVISYLLKLNTP